MISTFFRLLASPIPAKVDDLRQQIAALKQGQPVDGIFQSEPTNFNVIPGSPFAYWVEKRITDIFINQRRLDILAKQGLATGDDLRFLRLWWEVSLRNIAIYPNQNDGMWFLFAKGGPYSKFYSDVHLVINWGNDGEEIKIGAINMTIPGARPQNLDFSYRCGLTWSLRTTSGISVRTLPKGCLFGHKGPSVFVHKDDFYTLEAILSVMNSAFYLHILEMQLGAATSAARSYEVGVIQQTPIPTLLPKMQKELAELTQRAYDLARQPALNDETTHVFRLPALMSAPGATLTMRMHILTQAESNRQEALNSLQSHIDTYVADLYGMPELAGDSNLGAGIVDHGEVETNLLDDEEVEEAESLVANPHSMVSDFIMWCVGVAFGRWDVRFALDPSRLPPLPGPFDPLPVCSPGMLVGADRLPASSAPTPYPLSPAFNGFLVDDPTHPRDIIAAVRSVLHLLWQDQAESIEAEACQYLNVPDLRAWLRDPKGFFAYHIKRYSKSRRKAPIYWLLQSARRNYGIWLYYPRLNPGSLFRAGREYADAKLNLETSRLEELHNELLAAAGSARKLQERRLAAQTALVAEIKDFVKTLDAAALLELQPDLNDGVLLNIAPLHALTAWKEAGRLWQELLGGKYEWSSIGKQLRHKGLIKK